jgi:NitT/TauT family transport system substrate-binding protein
MPVVQRFLRPLAVVLLGAVLCAPAPARADDTLTEIGGANPTGFYEILDHVAHYAGFYRAEHLDVQKEYVSQGSSASCAQLVATGKADICTIGTEPIITGYDKGLRLQSFFSRGARYAYVLAVLADSPIRTLADFKGKTLGEMTVGSPGEINAQATLAGAGLKKSDFSYLPIGYGAAAVTALTTKKVDGAAFPYTELAIYEVKAGLKLRFFWNPLIADVSDEGFVATPAVIAAKAPLLERYARALVKASILIRENPPLAARYFLEGAGIPITPQSLADQIRLLSISQDMLPDFDSSSKKIGYMSPAGMQLYCTFLYQSGVTTTLVPAAALVTNQFIGYANDFDHRAFVAAVKRMR